MYACVCGKSNDMKKINDRNEKIKNIDFLIKQNEITIYTERVEMQSLNQHAEDFLIEKYTGLLQSPENIALFCEGEPWTTCQIKTLIRNEMQKWNEGNRFCIFSVHDSKTKKIMGSLHISHALQEYAAIGIHGHENVAEIGYILDSEFWGKGYGTEIAMMGLEYVKHIIGKYTDAEFKELPIPKEAIATVHPLNEGSKRILQKIFAYQEPVEFIKYNGQPRLLFFTPLV